MIECTMDISLCESPMAATRQPWKRLDGSEHFEKIAKMSLEPLGLLLDLLLLLLLLLLHVFMTEF